jgi:hypothetical protein
MLGIVGGAILTLAIAISSAQLISSAHYIASCCCGSTSNRLLILDGIILQLIQNSVHTNDFFFYTKNFLTHNNFHALLIKLCPLKHLNTALDGLLLLIITVNIILGWGTSWGCVYVLIFPQVATAPFVVSSIIIIMYKKNQNITPLPFFRGFSNTVPFF